MCKSAKNFMSSFIFSRENFLEGESSHSESIDSLFWWNLKNSMLACLFLVSFLLSFFSFRDVTFFSMILRIFNIYSLKCCFYSGLSRTTGFNFSIITRILFYCVCMVFFCSSVSESLDVLIILDNEPVTFWFSWVPSKVNRHRPVSQFFFRGSLRFWSGLPRWWWTCPEAWLNNLNIINLIINMNDDISPFP